MPPLRLRTADIPLLVNHFVTRLAMRMQKEVGPVPGNPMASLVRHDWPGNVRELQNVIERAVILYSNGGWHFTLDNVKPADDRCEDRQRTMAEAERYHILTALRDSRGVVEGRNGAAVRLGLPRTTLLARMKRLELSFSDSPLRFELGDSINAPIRHAYAPNSSTNGSY
jgi:DNA-binding NtrC family response regulator